MEEHGSSYEPGLIALSISLIFTWGYAHLNNSIQFWEL